MEEKPKRKVALLFISLNSNYWPYVEQVIEDCNKFFLSDHRLNVQLDFFLWTDLPEGTTYGATVIPTEPQPWPIPTLMRYHLFLQEKEKLEGYDYLYYLDADMRVVAPIGEEIFTDGLMVAEHPMYAVDKHFIPPYEPSKDSTAFVKRLGIVITDEDTGRPRFKPVYAAGGFQGGAAKVFIKAMEAMRDSVDKDFNRNYIAIWNDESHWNKYLYDYEGPLTVLSPAYVYPDSLIKEYYEPRVWGRSYEPKIVTLTKPFSLSKEGGQALQQFLGPATLLTSCPTCGDQFTAEQRVIKIIECEGRGNNHKVQQNA